MNLVLSEIAENLRVIAILLQPFVPSLANNLLDVLNVKKSERTFDFIKRELSLHDHKINEPKIIFPRLEKK